MTKIIVCGIGGKMGMKILETLTGFDDVTCVAGIDAFSDKSKFSLPVFDKPQNIDVQADVIVDFSRPEALDGLLAYAKANNVPLVLATTGYSKEQEEAVRQAAKSIAIFRASNMSLGVNLLVHLCKKAAAILGDGFDVEIVETHHNKKVDSPSGTALTLANAIKEEKENSYLTFGRHGNDTKRKAGEIGVHAVRGGTIVGKHEVHFFGEDEVVTLTHEAHSKAVFAQGAIRAAAFVAKQKPGLYSMPDLVASL